MMHFGKNMSKALSVVLSAAMLFSSSAFTSIPTVKAAGTGMRSATEEMLQNRVGEKTSVSKPSDLEAGSAIQFDFGTTTTAGSPFITIKGSSAYSASTGYGWTTGTAIEKNGGVNTSKAPGWLDETPDSALKTACQDFVGAKAGTDIGFQVDVPNGTYTVTVYAGENTNGWAEETVSVNGEELGRTKKVTTGSVPTGYATSIDEEAFKHVKQIVTEGNKGITLNIKSSKTNSRAYVNAMVITCDELAASETYSIRYNANGAAGTVPSDKTGLDSNNEVSLEKNPAITKEGYRLTGWATDADATEGSFTYSYSEDDAIQGVVTLYAVWAREYSIAYNSNGGDSNVPVSTEKYVVGEKITLDDTTKPARQGYKFLGWSGNADAESAVTILTVAESNIKNDVIQVYAVWQQEGIVNLKFDFGGKGTANGFTAITTQTYDAEVGYGFTSTTTLKNDKGTNMGTAAPTDADVYDMCKDYTYTESSDGLAFRVDVPAGVYDVSVYAGLGGDHTPTIKVNDKDLGKAATTKPANEKDILKTATVTVEAGGYITVTSSGFKGRNMLNGIIIRTSENGVFPAPQNVTASADATSVRISWDSVAGATHYNIFRENKLDNRFLQIGSTTGSDYVDSILTNQQYEYYVVAVKKDEQEVQVSDPSEKVTSSIESRGSVGSYAPAEEYSDRALVAVKAEEGVFVSWRLYETDSDNITFTVKRNGTQVYQGSATSFMDKAGKAGDSYTLAASEGLSTRGESTTAWNKSYQEFELEVPANQKMPDGSVAVYEANDLSVGDLDGDGDLELIVKWYPNNAQDNSLDGYTGTTILDAYDIDIATGAAELLWRIDLGLNIRSGAHYTQFQVWDFDGDGKAEVICKTADGTTTYDGNLRETGHVGAVSMNALDISAKGTPEDYDFRQHKGRLGRIVLGDEYLTAFDGVTGEIIDNVNYVPFRGAYDEKTGIYDTSGWGNKNGAPAEKNDGYANRADRFLSATAYLDGGTASAVFSRGYYGRTAITAWKLVNDKLVMQWAFDADTDEDYSAQGNHGLSINDADGDGYDEIIFAGLVLNSDGTPRFSTEWGHGDAMHVSDWDGDGKLEVYKVNEEHWGAGVYDPDTGEIEWFESTNADTGRGVAADVDPRYAGGEMWHSLDTHTHRADGEIIYEAKPSQNFTIFWDGDLLKELLDSDNSTHLSLQVQKWNYVDLTTEVLLDEKDTILNNGTKANAGLVADICGDWREEILVRDRNDSSKLRLYSTTCETPYSLPTFLENRAYREGVAWQNVGYNQPANVTYLLSKGIAPATITEIERTTSTETLTWTAASDGVYGVEIEGYEIYRASSADSLWEDYVLLDTVSADTRSYTDTGLESNTEYTYIVAAVIGGRTSYKSFAVSAKTTVAAAGVQAVEPITLVQADTKYTEKFPKTVVVIDAAGKEEQVDIAWDYSGVQIETAGERTVYGSVYGYSELIPVQVTVLKNKITAVEVEEEVYTLVGVEPVLPSTANLKMFNSVDETGQITWTKSYDITKAGDYQITGNVTCKYDTAEITMTVHIAEDYIVALEKLAPVTLDFESEAAAKLPAKVRATYASDGRKEEVPVTWSYVDTTMVGEATVNGIVAGYADYAELLVKVDYPMVKKFDFGITASTVEDGWIGISAIKSGGKTAEQLGAQYTAEKGYGFKPSDALDGRDQKYTQDGLYPATVYNDFLITSTASASSTFMVDVENGEYVVEMISGSTDKSTIKVNIEGNAYSVGNSASTYSVGRFEDITVTDGQLTMEFTAGNLSRVCAVMIHKVVESQNASASAAQKTETAIEALPETDSRLTPYDVQKIENIAETVEAMSESEKDALSEDAVEKLDELYAKAKSLVVEVNVSAPAGLDAGHKLSGDDVTVKGMATASGAEEGIVEVELKQQTPTKDTGKAQLEFVAKLKVNAQEAKLKAPLIISIDIPDGVDMDNLVIKHYTEKGALLGTISRGNRMSSTRYVVEGRKISFRVNSFSIFTFVADRSAADNDNDYDYEDDYDYSDSSSSSSSAGTSVKKPQPIVTPAGKWVLDANGWWYSYLAGGYPANKWEMINGKWYFFEPNGYMKANGWVTQNSVWYYCKADGAMADAEWILDNGRWYYLSAGGAMAANGWILDKGIWYYLNTDGSMFANTWIFYKNQWYYLKSDGAMAVNEVTPDGYKVNADGVWIP